ncbi:MAG: GMC oxidoreductase [Stellaceae bacterium]
MFIDARTLPEAAALDADICIIGAGAAGITLARDLAGGGRRIMLLESGGLDFEVQTQRLCDGAVVGHAMAPLSVERLRYFGGSTNHWSGGCQPFEAQDFAARPYMPESGWPIGLNDLDPYYRRAQAICQLGAYTYDPQDWADELAGPLELAAGAALRSGLSQYSPPTRFGEVYRSDLAKAEGVAVHLHANVVDIKTNDSASSVTGLHVACLDGRRFRATAKAYVLATGGIENPRLLLSANHVQKPGLGNPQDLVGRYFMDHPYIPQAAVVAFDRKHPALAFYEVRQVRGTRVQGYFRPTSEAAQAAALPNFGIGLRAGTLSESGSARASLRVIYESFAGGRWPDQLSYHMTQILHSVEGHLQEEYYHWTHSEPALYSTSYMCECPPDRDSRVTLGDDVDALGMRRVKIDWRLPPELEQNMVRAHELLARELGRLGIGRLRMNSRETGRDPMADLTNGYHHMGTTRMHDDPRHGVVDADCRVHGIDNLFVAGSSVFPTYSFDNPTMTIVALALRLSDHLKSGALSALDASGHAR